MDGSDVSRKKETSRVKNLWTRHPSKHETRVIECEL